MQELLDSHAPEGMQEWAAKLPNTVTEIAAHWGLTLGSAFEPGGQCSWTAPCGDFVLKVGWRHPEAEHEADALRRWDGDGVVRVHDELLTNTSRALLLERCSPGKWLQESLAPERQDAVLAGLLRRLWTADPTGFPTLAAMCDEWADEAEQRDSTTDRHLMHDGLAVLRELPRTSSTLALLCTDLHAMNVLAAEREPWLVVDPKPHAGDPHYDVTQHLFNNDQRLDADPMRWIRRMAALCDLDSSRVAAWMFGRLVQESTRRPWYSDVARRIRL
jgi:streptomycin 6-kinase